MAENLSASLLHHIRRERRQQRRPGGNLDRRATVWVQDLGFEAPDFGRLTSSRAQVEMLAVWDFEKQLGVEGLRLWSLKTYFPGLDSRSIQRPRQLCGQYDHPLIDQ